VESLLGWGWFVLWSKSREGAREVEGETTVLIVMFILFIRNFFFFPVVLLCIFPLS